MMIAYAEGCEFVHSLPFRFQIVITQVLTVKLTGTPLVKEFD
jgi:hypothetical protein